MMNEKIFCYLTVAANHAVNELTNAGLDKDLALSVLEQVWSEEEIYELPARDEVL